jgi:hypothetical protein
MTDLPVLPMRRNKGQGLAGSAGMVRLRQAGVFFVKSRSVPTLAVTLPGVRRAISAGARDSMGQAEEGL